MDNIMAVLLNGVAQLEYDRSKPLPPHQAAYLDKMDDKMDQGIMLEDQLLESPSLDDKARFIAANLLSAMKNDDEAMSASLCTWLANRLPELKQVKYVENNDEIVIDLVFDEAYKKQVAVELKH